MFLQQRVNTGGLPFHPHTKQPNTETLTAMKELENGGGEKFDNTDEFYKDMTEFPAVHSVSDYK